MTTWYECPGGWSYSVRPDLWPAGSHAWVIDSEFWLANWGSGTPGQFQAPRDQWAHPGAWKPGTAEALILAGQVVHGTGANLGLTWTRA